MAGIVYEPAPAPAAPPVGPVSAGSPFSPQTFRTRDDMYGDFLAQALRTPTTGILDGLAKVATSGFLGWQKGKNQERADSERAKASADVSKLLEAMVGGRKSAPAAASGGDKLTNAMVQSRTGLSGDALGDGKLPRDMIQKESGGRQFAKDGKPLTSSAGAIGVAQVMPGTAPEAARLAGVPFDDTRYRTDPAYNELLGAAYFDAQMQKYNDPELARAAYNAGPGRVDQYIGSGRPLPAETVAYADLNGDGVIGGGRGLDTMGGPAVMPVGAGDMPLNPSGPEMPASMQPGYQPIGTQVPQQAAQGQATPQAAGGNPQLQAALAIMSNPWADEGQKQVAGLILAQTMKADAPVNGIEIGNRLVNPRTGAVMADFSGGQQFRPMTAEEKAAAGLPAEGNFQIGPDGKISQIGGSGTTINLNSASNQEAIRSADQALQGAQAAIGALDRALALNEQAASGQFAGIEQMLDRVIAPDQAAATTEMNTLIMGTALDQLKAIFGGNPTEGERKILLDMQGIGNMTRAERAAVLRNARAAAERRLALAQAQSQDLRSGDYYKEGYQLPQVPSPQGAPPVAQPQAPAITVQPSGGAVIRYDAQGNRIP